MSQDCTAILLAAGRSQRLGFDKVLTPLAGRPAFTHSLASLAAAESIREIIIVTREDIREQIETIARGIVTTKPFRVVPGGKERQDSVHAGLKNAGDSEYVAIHDAARPLLKPETVELVLASARKTGAAIAASKATDTIKRADASGLVDSTLDRSTLWTIQTPQIFRKELILRALDHVQTSNIPVTDDASAVEALGGKVTCVEVADLNLKITRAHDWHILEQWLTEPGRIRIRRLIHDVSNLSNPLIGYLPLLERNRQNEEKFRSYLTTAQSSADKLQESLRELQSLSRTCLPQEKSSSSE